MKILAIGDVHGEDWWKSIVFGAEILHESFVKRDKIMYDNFKFLNEDMHVVFVGDYVDSLYLSTPEIIENLKQIVDLAKTFPNNFTLLLGNHDIQYINTRHICDGFRAEAWPDLEMIFNENRNLFKAAFIQDNHLITHAGLTQNTWNACIEFLDSTDLYDWKDPSNNLADHLNFLYDIHFEPIFYGSMKRGSTRKNPGIFWADKKELINDPLTGYSQIVGHTFVKNKESVKLLDKDYLHFINTMDDNSFIFID